MSALERTIKLLNTLPDEELERVYSYAQFLSSRSRDTGRKQEPIDQVLDRLAGLLPDEGKSAKDYRQERLAERYGYPC